jgi:hypothetical protein
VTTAVAVILEVGPGNVRRALAVLDTLGRPSLECLLEALPKYGDHA